MVTIRGYSTAETCVWCARRGESFDADFGTLKGWLCRSDLLKAIRVRAEKKEKRTDVKSGPVNEK